MTVDELRVMGRATQGVKVIKLSGDDEIASVAKIEESILAMSPNLSDDIIVPVDVIEDAEIIEGETITPATDEDITPGETPSEEPENNEE
jgi:DNA gyrase subunit A